jgi:branched-chain amino acid transport system substrate-binding protein
VNAWYNQGNPVIPNLRWFMSNGARLPGFLAGAPAGVRGMCGTAPTYQTGSAPYVALKTAYEARHPDKIDQQVYGPNVWDAFHLIGAAIAQQAVQYPAEAAGGEHLRDALTTVSKGGRVLDATHWGELTAAVRSGTDVDYDGASGPNDFDANGQVVGPFEVWCISNDGTRFEQRLVLTAQEISTAVSN